MNKSPPYHYRTKPLGKQLDVIERSWHEKVHALLCRPGTGKTKLSLDTAGMLYTAGKILGLLVIAPNGVDAQWVSDGIPTHLSPGVPWMGGCYTSRMGKRAYHKLFQKLNSSDMGLRVLTMSFEGVQTPRGRGLAESLLRSHPTLMVIDESHRASNHKSATFKALSKLTPLAAYVRIATGTLITQNPFAAWAQFELLGHGLLGYTTLASFKSMYAEMLPADNGLVKRIARDFKERTGRTITPQIVSKDAEGRPQYRNLRHLRQRLEPFSSFLSLADVNGTEPTVFLSTRFVELSEAQQQVYDELEVMGVTEANGNLLTAIDSLSLGTRLAQITGGFMPSDDDPEARPVGESNPKVEAVLELAEELGDEPVIIWCRFRAELSAVAAALSSSGYTVAEYHGGVSAPDREESKRRFRSGEARFFVAQVRAGGTGLDGLQAVANYMVFYSNEYPYLLREQAIARLARTGGKLTVNVVDIVALGTTDEDVVRCMRTAEDVHVAVLHRGIVSRRSPELQEPGV